MKRTAEPLTARQKDFLLDLIARVLGIRHGIFASLILWEMGIPIGGAALLQRAANAALRCKGVLPVPVRPVDGGTHVDTQGLAAAAAGLAQQGNENAPTIAPSVAGNDKTPPAPQNPIESPSRASERKSAPRQKWIDYSIPLKDGIMREWLDAFARAIVRESAMIATVDGVYVIGLRPKGGLGERFYNNREYAKHVKLFQRYRAAFPYVVCFTKTAGTEYDIDGLLVDGAQFCADMKHRLARLAKNHGARYMFSSEFGEEGHLHCHGMLFFKELPRAMSFGEGGTNVDEKSRSFLNGYLDFQDFEKVQWLDESRAMDWFNYCHKYTRYTAAQWLALDDEKDAEQKAAVQVCLENLMLCQYNHVEHWASSGSKGLEPEPAQDTDVSPVPAAPFEGQSAQDTEYDSVVFALQNALKPETDDKAVLLAVKNAIKMVFPCACVDRYIINDTYKPVHNTKLSEWREKALRGSKIKTCDCFFKQLYFYVSDLLLKSA